ncbi:DNA topoisomerase 3 [Parasphaerochaeta coccoides]|uniref:DNA topoisomerase n=1 Tax=Parasphaerochaeta coccoides (strain ATCC BAA-1237 / DSM 17374 / SPN1) TaxID=760011 RepID=F4GHA7_PARC1|nr:DNA topoisomerase 3 [Parasphaerochaeta coccoides]AEC02006.1 DNA topoisomerase III [Parasphaerochaeta coccoides DSM 17374]
MKKIVLAEKPSVGRELARVLGCTGKEKGFSEGPAYIVTWALGHLVELAQPAAYSESYKRWSIRDLPMLPKDLKQEVIEQTAEQFTIISTLFARPDVDGLIIATDAGREGELVARWIMKLGGWKGSVQRLWISSQTDSAIREGFSSLKDGDVYLNLYAAAESRAAADWYVGMNVTRAMTCRYDAKLSAGRVQTPTLALMCAREDEIDAFTGSFYWTLKADFGSFSASWRGKDDSARITNAQSAEDFEKSLPGKTGKITALTAQEKTVQPPLAYDLTELQKDANNVLDFSAKQTLDVLQRLYEVHKIVTYPRTDSRYISHDIVPTLADRLRALAGTPFGPRAGLYAGGMMRVDEQRFVQDEQVTDHHAIIPTEMKVDLKKLNTEEKALWELVIIRFLEVLSPDYTYTSTSLEAEADGQKFVTRFTVPLVQGWRDIARIIGRRSAVSDEDEGDSDSSLSGLKEGDDVAIVSVKTRRMTTAAPERYTEATLLSAMEHAGRFVDDVSLKKRLGNGLGTPATRADIIEKLLQNHYVEREGKSLVPTPRGRELIRLVPAQLRSPELTGRWEERLAGISDGSEDAAVFIRDIKKNASDLVDEVVASHLVFDPHFPDGKKCPYCATAMMRVVDEFERPHYICQKLSCSYEEMEVKKKVLLPPGQKAPESQKSPEKKKAETAGISTAKPVIPTKRVKPTSTVVVASSAGIVRKVVIKKRPPASVISVPDPVKKSQGVMNSFSLPDDEEPEYTWETVMEVVRPSKMANRRFNDRERSGQHEHGDFRRPSRAVGEGDAGSRSGEISRNGKAWGNAGKPVEEPVGAGGTFADFLAASQKRKEKDEEKRRERKKK